MRVQIIGQLLEECPANVGQIRQATYLALVWMETVFSKNKDMSARLTLDYVLIRNRSSPTTVWRVVVGPNKCRAFWNSMVAMC